MNIEVKAITPIATPTIYEDISVDDLLLVYKQAYVAAGFEFKEQTTRTDKWKQDHTHLVFEFSIPEYPLKKKGIVSFNIDSSKLSPKCAPCSVYGEVFGGVISGSTEYSSEEWAIFLPKMIAADEKAMGVIQMELGKIFDLHRQTSGK